MKLCVKHAGLDTRPLSLRLSKPAEVPPTPALHTHKKMKTPQRMLHSCRW